MNAIDPVLEKDLLLLKARLERIIEDANRALKRLNEEVLPKVSR